MLTHQCYERKVKVKPPGPEPVEVQEKLSGAHSLYFYGAYKRKVDKASVGISIQDENGHKMFGKGLLVENTHSNNEGEYVALALGLEWCISMGIKRLNIFGDALLLIKQVHGTWACRNQSVVTRLRKVKELIKRFEEAIQLYHVPRKENQEPEPTQGSPKRPQQEEEEEIEDIQADFIPPSPINIPPAPPSSPITPFPPASTPQTPPSPLPLETPKSPPAPTSPQQHHFSAESSDIPAPLTEETAQPMETQTPLQKETIQPMEKTEETKQTDGRQQQPTEVDVPILIVQKEEPTSQEAILEVKSFDYTKLIQTLSRQFQCQQVVAKETEIQKDRANKAQEEIVNLRTTLELVTKNKDSSARENENLLRDLIDLQSQLTRKEAQNHELIKNEKKMKEQLKYEDARFQKLTASYTTVKNTLTALLQNQEPAAAVPSTSDSAAINTLAALQEELQTEKLQRQLLVSGFMS
ncbi:hypothetical protein L7F22_038037 [Adiantum nelumboides]|nr:hypothetical protein [Adiantum nelumboides]